MTYGTLVAAAAVILNDISCGLMLGLFKYWIIGMFIGFNLLIRAFLAFLACQRFLLIVEMVLKLYI